MNSLPNVTEMPFNLPGNIYRGCMPYSYNWQGKEEPLEVYKKVYGISCIVILTSAKESETFARRNLPELYSKEGFEVVHFPIKDFSTPEMEPLSELIEKIHELALKKHNILVHCISGKGRTGLVMACLAKKEFNLNGEDAIEWVRSRIPGAVETPTQEKFIANYVPKALIETVADETDHDDSQTGPKPLAEQDVVVLPSSEPVIMQQEEEVVVEEKENDSSISFPPNQSGVRGNEEGGGGRADQPFVPERREARGEIRGKLSLSLLRIFEPDFGKDLKYNK